jgi:hypothetical protein
MHGPSAFDKEQEAKQLQIEKEAEANRLKLKKGATR